MLLAVGLIGLTSSLFADQDRSASIFSEEFAKPIVLLEAEEDDEIGSAEFNPNRVYEINISTLPEGDDAGAALDDVADRESGMPAAPVQQANANDVFDTIRSSSVREDSTVPDVAILDTAVDVKAKTSPFLMWAVYGAVVLLICILTFIPMRAWYNRVRRSKSEQKAVRAPLAKKLVESTSVQEVTEEAQNRWKKTSSKTKRKLASKNKDDEEPAPAEFLKKEGPVRGLESSFSPPPGAHPPMPFPPHPSAGMAPPPPPGMVPPPPPPPGVYPPFAGPPMPPQPQVIYVPVMPMQVPLENATAEQREIIHPYGGAKPSGGETAEPQNGQHEQNGTANGHTPSKQPQQLPDVYKKNGDKPA